MTRTMRGFMIAAGCLTLGMMHGCATGGGGGGGGAPAAEEITYNVDPLEAGTIAVTEDETATSAGPADLGGEAPAGSTAGTISVAAENVDFVGDEGMAVREAEITVHIAPGAAETPCADEFEVLRFTATATSDGTTTLEGASAALDADAIELVSQRGFALCFEVVANFDGTVEIDFVDISLTGAADGNDNVDGEEFYTCTSPGGEDEGVEFGEPGTTRVVASTLGEGRHMALVDDTVLLEGWNLVYQFDQPVRTCAVIPEHFTLTEVGSGEEIALAAENLAHAHIVEGGVVVASQISITLPAAVQAGADYELVLSAAGLSLDGEFAVNSGTNLAANGTLPSGDGVAGGDFVQLFRAVGVSDYLTAAPAAGGMALDEADQLYIVAEEGLYGPFDAPGQVTEADRLGATLPLLSSRNVVWTAEGTLIVKGRSDGKIFEVDPDTGAPTEVAIAADLDSYPKASVRAPEGYASIELAGVQPGDILFADDSGISVLDLPGQAGQKGGVDLVERSDISSAYVNLWTPPRRGSRPGEIYGGHKPEESDGGFEIHRILPNGLTDRAVLPGALFGFEGSSATHLEDIQGRQEFLLLGDLTDTTTLDTKQLFPQGFDGVGVYVYEVDRDRLQLVAPLPLKTFAFDFAAFSQVVLTPDYARAYVTMPTANLVLALEGLSNENTVGNWPCDDIHDLGVDFADGGPAQVVATSFGVGRYLLAGAPTVVEFEFDRPVPYCSFTADNVTLIDRDDPAEAEISLEAGDVKRIPIYDGSIMLACRAMIDLPPTLEAGHRYQLTLSGDGFNLDGEFDGTLPSGDGSPGGDFVQTFRLIAGSNFLTETRSATGLTLDNSGRLFVANEEQLFGPFATPAEVTAADELGELPLLSGGGRPIAAANNGNVIAAGRNNGTVLTIDPETGAVTEIGRQAGGTFEIDVVIAPPGFTAPGVAAGDIIVCNEGRGTVPDLISGSGATQIFSDSDISSGYTNFFVTPPDILGPPLLYGGYRVSAADVGYTFRRITPDGDQVDLLPEMLTGVDGKGGVRLPDYDGEAEFLILADFSQASSPQLPTGQIRAATGGLELLVYDVATGRLQMLGALSRGLEGAFTSPEPDLAFSDDLTNVYVTQPITRTVVELTGFGSE